MDIVIHKNQWYWGSTLTIVKNDGMASVELQLDNKYPTIAFVKGLIVHDTCRKQGIGNAMLDACIIEAFKCEKSFLQLNVKKDSWVVGWYKRRGFIIIYEDDDEYTMWKPIRVIDEPSFNHVRENVIENANKWLSLNLKMLMNVLDVEYDAHEIDIKDFIEDFKKAMKGE